MYKWSWKAAFNTCSSQVFEAHSIISILHYYELFSVGQDREYQNIMFDYILYDKNKAHLIQFEHLKLEGLWGMILYSENESDEFENEWFDNRRCGHSQNKNTTY